MKKLVGVIILLGILLLTSFGLVGCFDSSEEQNEQSVGVVSVVVNDDLHLIIGLSDGTSIDAGYVGVLKSEAFIIDDEVYFFNDDRVREEKHNEFFSINDNVYYAEHNIIVKGLKIIEDRVYDFGDDGKMKDVVFHNEFVTIDTNVYYVVNNYIVKNYYIVEDRVYDFGDDGVLTDREYNNEFIKIDEDTYYVVKNYIVKNHYIIEDKMYDFGNDGKLIDKIINNEFITIDVKVYYVVNNYIVKNYYIIEDRMYDFGDDGVLIDRDFNNEFVNIGEDTYYVVNNYIVKNYYFIENRVYYFGNNGVMIKDVVFEGYTFNSEGFIIEDEKFITINENTYFLMQGIAVITYSYGGKIIVSDADSDISNNDNLTGAKITIICGTYIFDTISDAEGNFFFEHLPSMEITVTVEMNNYITVVYVITLTETSTKTIVMDIDVSNNLYGKISLADQDTDLGNNVSLEGVEVSLVRTSSTNNWEYNTTTDAEGNYSFARLTAGEYVLRASKEGYITITQTIYVHYNQENVYNIMLEMINSTDTTTVGNASGYIYDNKTGNVIANLTLYVREGINNVDGEVLLVTETTSSGEYFIEGLPAGNYSVQIVDEREGVNEEEKFGNGIFYIKIIANILVSNQHGFVGTIGGLTAESMRIVLTWGSSPSDLDSHLVIDRENGVDEHVYFSDKTANNTNLDVDDTTSYGPETITITKIESGTKYYYYVYNYSGGSDSVLSSSGAVINIYIGVSSVPFYTFNVPVGLGRFWNVFCFDADTGIFTFSNTITSSEVIS